MLRIARRPPGAGPRPRGAGPRSVTWKPLCSWPTSLRPRTATSPDATGTDGFKSGRKKENRCGSPVSWPIEPPINVATLSTRQGLGGQRGRQPEGDEGRGAGAQSQDSGPPTALHLPPTGGNLDLWIKSICTVFFSNSQGERNYNKQIKCLNKD